MHPSYRIWIACAIITPVISACQPSDPITPTPAQTPTAAPAATVTPPQLGPAVTPTMPPWTPIPALAWATGISPVRLNEAYGHWAPDVASLLLSNCRQYPRSADAIALAEAPDYEPHTLNDTDFTCDDHPDGTLEWSPDGAHILFIGRSTSDTTDSRFSTSIWRMERDGSNPHPLDPDDALWWPEFLGWMSDSTLAVSSYTGGGSHQADIRNIDTGKLLARSVIWGGWYAPGSTFVSGTVCMPVCFLTAMSPQVQSSPVKWYPSGSEYGILPAGSSYGEKTDFATVDSVMQWLPGANKVLYAVKYWQGDGFAQGSWLAVWDLDARASSMLAPDGFYGRLSPDGRYLGYLTVGPQQLDEHSHPIDNDVHLIPAGAPIYLHILDTVGGSLIFSKIVPEHDADTLNAQPAAGFAFSPDSRYLAAVISQEGDESLVVLDLTTQEIVSVAASMAWRPVWSPDSQWIAFRRPEGDLALLARADWSLSAITQGAGSDRFMQVAWSPDSAMMSITWAEGDLGKQQLALVGLP